MPYPCCCALECSEADCDEVTGVIFTTTDWEGNEQQVSIPFDGNNRVTVVEDTGDNFVYITLNSSAYLYSYIRNPTSMFGFNASQAKYECTKTLKVDLNWRVKTTYTIQKRNFGGIFEAECIIKREWFLSEVTNWGGQTVITTQTRLEAGDPTRWYYHEAGCGPYEDWESWYYPTSNNVTTFDFPMTNTPLPSLTAIHTVTHSSFLCCQLGTVSNKEHTMRTVTPIHRPSNARLFQVSPSTISTAVQPQSNAASNWNTDRTPSSTYPTIGRYPIETGIIDQASRLFQGILNWTIPLSSQLTLDSQYTTNNFPMDIIVRQINSESSADSGPPSYSLTPPPPPAPLFSINTCVETEQTIFNGHPDIIRTKIELY